MISAVISSSPMVDPLKSSGSSTGIPRLLRSIPRVAGLDGVEIAGALYEPIWRMQRRRSIRFGSKSLKQQSLHEPAQLRDELRQVGPWRFDTIVRHLGADAVAQREKLLR